jgi:hypothetical protein
MTTPSTRDVVIVGGGHNALVTATILARPGRSVLVLDCRDEVGGATVSTSPFRGVDARLSRYSCLVSLFPTVLARSLGLSVDLRRRAHECLAERLPRCRVIAARHHEGINAQRPSGHTARLMHIHTGRRISQTAERRALRGSAQASLRAQRIRVLAPCITASQRTKGRGAWWPLEARSYGTVLRSSSSLCWPSAPKPRITRLAMQNAESSPSPAGPAIGDNRVFDEAGPDDRIRHRTAPQRESPMATSRSRRLSRRGTSRMIAFASAWAPAAL